MPVMVYGSMIFDSRLAKVPLRCVRDAIFPRRCTASTPPLYSTLTKRSGAIEAVLLALGPWLAVHLEPKLTATISHSTGNPMAVGFWPSFSPLLVDMPLECLILAPLGNGQH
jgi:hypothetical protein